MKLLEQKVMKSRREEMNLFKEAINMWAARIFLIINFSMIRIKVIFTLHLNGIFRRSTISRRKFGHNFVIELKS
jgi:hypothetical protein